MIEINMNLVYTIINVIILYLLLRHFLIKPVTDIMEKRKQLIADGLQSAQDAQDGALKMKQEYEAALNGAKQESVHRSCDRFGGEDCRREVGRRKRESVVRSVSKRNRRGTRK